MLKIQNAVSEQLQCLLFRLLKVIEALVDIVFVHLLKDILHVLHDRWICFCCRTRWLITVKVVDAHHVKDQNRVMRHQEAARLRHDVWMWNTFFITKSLQHRHDVVRVLLFRIVHRAF
ncbi:hypothetical protein D3C87_1446110 [compost metagenome]